MVVSVRTRALMFLLMAARVLGPLPSLTRLPSSPARRRRGAPALALPPRAGPESGVGPTAAVEVPGTRP